MTNRDATNPTALAAAVRTALRSPKNGLGRWSAFSHLLRVCVEQGVLRPDERPSVDEADDCVVLLVDGARIALLADGSVEAA